MPLELLLQRGPPRRVVCCNDVTHRALWPCFFASAVRAALPLCRWAAARGAAAHGALRLQHDDVRGCHLVVTRALPPGCALLSLPTALALSCATVARARRGRAGDDDDSGDDAFASSASGGGGGGGDVRADELRFLSAVERLAMVVARDLHDRRSPHRLYLELLHDLHNADADDELHDAVATAVRATMAAGADADGGVSRVRSATATTALLQARVVDMHGGNALRARGVGNAPFLDRTALQSPRQRVTWSRVRVLLRRLEQSLPYFAVRSAAWAVSMVLSRTVDATAACGNAHSGGGDGLTMYPLIDFCSHSRRASACLRFCPPQRAAPRGGGGAGGDGGLRGGVRGCAADVACVHLCATRALARGDEVTLCYSNRDVSTADDADYWRMRYGFVPDE